MSAPRSVAAGDSRALELERAIIALDTPDLSEAYHIMDALTGLATFFKVGLELFSAVGPAAVQAVKERGHRVFLDLKLHDIPNTVAGAARSARRMAVDMLTVHVTGGPAMLRAAAAELPAHEPLLLMGVTVLTSLSRADLDMVGLTPGSDIQEVVTRLGCLAIDSGCRGLIAAGSDAATLRNVLGRDPIIVTPGVRPAWAAANDQKRIVTPRAALAAGADHVVVGRSVTVADDPRQAFERLME